MKYFSINELTKSATAKRLGIDNTPTTQVTNNLVALVNGVLDPVREAFGQPIIVTSGYRCKALNKAVGGVATSQHQLGQAADIHTVSDTYKDNKKLWDLICAMVAKGKIDTGQYIWEYGNKNGPDWIHISTRGNHHNQKLFISKKMRDELFWKNQARHYVDKSLELNKRLRQLRNKYYNTLIIGCNVMVWLVMLCIILLF